MKTNKRLSVIALLLTIFVCAAFFTGCGDKEENVNTATADEATVSTATPDSAEEASAASPSEINDSATENKDTAPAETTADKNNTSPTEKNTADKTNTAPTEAKAGKSGSSNSSSASSKSNGSSSSAKSSSNTSGNNSSTSSSKSSATSSNSGSSSASSKPSGSGSASSKVWHEAEYEYIDHPAETKEVWVVDQAAYSYEKPIYEYPVRTICNQCGADITGNIDSHFRANIDTCWSYSGKAVKTQVGTKTVDVPEKGHWETTVVKEAWTEKKLVREAGYY